MKRSSKKDEVSLRVKHCLIFGTTGAVLGLVLWLSLRFLRDLIADKDKPADFDIWINLGFAIAALFPILFAIRGWVSGPKLQRQANRMRAKALSDARCPACGAQLAAVAQDIKFEFWSGWSWTTKKFCPTCTATPCFVEGCTNISAGGYMQRLRVGGPDTKAIIRSDACLCGHHRQLVDSGQPGAYQRKHQYTTKVGSRTDQSLYSEAQIF